MIGGFHSSKCSSVRAVRVGGALCLRGCCTLAYPPRCLVRNSVSYPYYTAPPARRSEFQPHRATRIHGRGRENGRLLDRGARPGLSCAARIPEVGKHRECVRASARGPQLCNIMACHSNPVIGCGGGKGREVRSPIKFVVSISRCRSVPAMPPHGVKLITTNYEVEMSLWWLNPQTRLHRYARYVPQPSLFRANDTRHALDHPRQKAETA